MLPWIVAAACAAALLLKPAIGLTMLLMGRPVSFLTVFQPKWSGLTASKGSSMVRLNLGYFQFSILSADMELEWAKLVAQASSQRHRADVLAIAAASAKVIPGELSAPWNKATHFPPATRH